MTEAEELEYFRLHADELNAEAEDVLSYQNIGVLSDAKKDEGTSPHPNSDALFALLSPIRGTVNIDEIRAERLAKHL